jgi:flagellar basal body rod protein FlgF
MEKKHDKTYKVYNIESNGKLVMINDVYIRDATEILVPSDSRVIIKNDGYVKKIKIRPYKDVKKKLDKLANETAYNSAIEFSKLFKGRGN